MLEEWRCPHPHVRSSPIERKIRKASVREERWICTDCGELFVPRAQLDELTAKYRANGYEVEGKAAPPELQNAKPLSG